MSGPYAGTRPGLPFLSGPEFVPYVYGTTLGTPSKGRPHKVAAALRDVEVLPAALAGVPDGPPNPPAGRRVLKPCGTVSAYQRHLRENRRRRAAGLPPLPDCEECLAANRVHVTAGKRAAGRHPCGYVEGSPGCQATCGDAP